VEGLSALDWTKVDNVQLTFAGQELHLLYPGVDGANYHLVFDVQQGRWRQYVGPGGQVATYIFGDSNRVTPDVLMAYPDGTVWKQVTGQIGDRALSGVVSPVPVYIRTPSWDHGAPAVQKEHGNAIVLYQGGPITVNWLTDGETTTDPSWTYTLPFSANQTQVPFSLGDIWGDNIAFDFSSSGNATIYTISVLHRVDEEIITHWEHRETSFGIPGWKHVRDGYIGINSSADCTLRMVVDGATYSYTIPSTNGERRQVYVKFLPVKGKMFRIFLDGPAFRFYSDDTYFYVKPWQTANSYTPIKLGGEGGKF
jgi:hypothetical protein